MLTGGHFKDVKSANVNPYSVLFIFPPVYWGCFSSYCLRSTLLHEIKVVFPCSTFCSQKLRQVHLMLRSKQKFPTSMTTFNSLRLIELMEQLCRNELLRAVELRLVVLKDELIASLKRAAGATLSVKQISDLAKFSQHFEVRDLRYLV